MGLNPDDAESRWAQCSWKYKFMNMAEILHY